MYRLFVIGGSADLPDRRRGLYRAHLVHDEIDDELVTAVEVVGLTRTDAEPRADLVQDCADNS